MSDRVESLQGIIELQRYQLRAADKEMARLQRQVDDLISVIKGMSINCQNVVDANTPPPPETTE